MSKWKAMFALTAVGALIAGPALAQTKSQNPQSSQSPSTTQPGSGSTSDTQKPMGSSTDKPGSTTGSTTDKSGSGSSSSSSTDTSKSGSGSSSTDTSSSTMGKSGSTTDKSGSTTDKSGSASDTQKSSGSQMGRMSSGQDETVKAAQQALKDKGHDPGAIDGVMGPHTMQALKDFQKAEGLKATGRLDSQTREKLGVASSSTTKQSK